MGWALGVVGLEFLSRIGTGKVVRLISLLRRLNLCLGFCTMVNLGNGLLARAVGLA